jgi:chromosome segregation ATPase
VTTTADDIEDTTGEMKETEAFVANLASQCALKKKEWAERCAMRAEEIAAVSQAIKILNDDDALDLFKKTLSLAQSSSLRFLQTSASQAVTLRATRALAAVASKDAKHAQQIALIQFALKAKAVDFSKILAQIDGMVKVLAEEQATDDETKAFCSKEIGAKDAEQADTEEAIAQSTAAIEDMTEESATLASEIASLQKEIKALDKAVAEATEQRKEEHSEFLTFQTENNAALQLIEKAKNALNKFYRPTLYKEAPKRELTDEEKILAASGRSDMIATAAPVFAQVRSSDDAAPPPPPATWDAYQKKDGKSNGVVALMDMLLKELQDGITQAEHEEETAQKDYERLMSDSQASREKMVESITAKEAAKAELDTTIVATKEKKASQEADLSNVKQYLLELHVQCDFIIENYDMRKAARENEVEGLKNAKSVLSGASFE